jgi:hypothetical protein
MTECSDVSPRYAAVFKGDQPTPKYTAPVPSVLSETSSSPASTCSGADVPGRGSEKYLEWLIDSVLHFSPHSEDVVKLKGLAWIARSSPEREVPETYSEKLISYVLGMGSSPSSDEVMRLRGLAYCARLDREGSRASPDRAG